MPPAEVLSRLDDVDDVVERINTSTTLVRSRLDTRTHCKAFLMTEEILSYTHPFRTPPCRVSVFSGGAEARIVRGNTHGSIINDRDGVSLTLNSSGLRKASGNGEKGEGDAKRNPDGTPISYAWINFEIRAYQPSSFFISLNMNANLCYNIVTQNLRYEVLDRKSINKITFIRIESHVKRFKILYEMIKY